MVYYKFDCTKGSNSNYWVELNCAAINTTVLAEMPEQFSLSVQNEWESRLPYMLSSVLSGVPLVGGALANLQNLTNENVAHQGLSFQMWMGSSPIEIPLQLQFDARNSALEDVFKPIQALVAMSLPTNRGNAAVGEGAILFAPGPKRGGSKVDGSVTVRVGKMFTFMECIVVSVDQQLDSRLDASGYPIAGEVNITIRTSKIIGKADWLQITNYESFV